jgi:hypothetical protein
MKFQANVLNHNPATLAIIVRPHAQLRCRRYCQSLARIVNIEWGKLALSSFIGVQATSLTSHPLLSWPQRASQSSPI